MKLHLWKYGVELMLWRSQIDEPDDEDPLLWTIWETVSIHVRRRSGRSSGSSSRFFWVYAWTYDGRRRFTLHVGQCRLDLWRDCWHESKPQPTTQPIPCPKSSI